MLFICVPTCEAGDVLGAIKFPFMAVWWLGALFNPNANQEGPRRAASIADPLAARWNPTCRWLLLIGAHFTTLQLCLGLSPTLQTQGSHEYRRAHGPGNRF